MLTPFSPPPGIDSDDTTFAAQGRWADGDNVRFYLGKPQPIGGWITSMTSAATGARNMFLLKIGASAYTIVGGNNALFAGTSSLSSIGSITSTDAGWSLAAYGATLMAVARGGPLYQWTGSGSASEITQSPNVITDMLVTPERQVLAFGCNEEISGTFNGMCIRGSDLENPTVWTTTAANNAFEHILEGQGIIVGARQIGAYVAVWTNTALHMGQFIGDPGQTYRFEKIDEGCGLLAADMVAVADGAAFWLGPDLRPRTWSPGSTVSVIPCPIFKDMADNLTTSESGVCFAFHNAKYNEIWFFFPDNRDAIPIPTRYIAIALSEGPSWFRGMLQRRAMIDGALAGAIAYAISNDGTVHQHEIGNLVRTWYIRSADQYIDNSQHRMMIRGVVPDFEDQTGDASLTLYCRDRPQSTAVTKGPYTLTTATTKKDFRASGKLIAVKISGAAGTYARLGKPLFDAVPMGER